MSATTELDRLSLEAEMQAKQKLSLGLKYHQ